jgi:hypothetical protein
MKFFITKNNNNKNFSLHNLYEINKHRTLYLLVQYYV